MLSDVFSQSEGESHLIHVISSEQENTQGCRAAVTLDQV